MTLTFGEKIKAARKAQKLTQKQLAEKIGAAHNSVSDWENDKNKPDPDTIELLCGVLNITPNYLLAVSTDDFSPAEKLLIKKYRDLDNLGREHVDALLDWESDRVKEIHELTGQILSLKTASRTIIDIQPRLDENKRSVKYFRSASAGSGIFILGNEVVEQITIPDTPENRKVDYAIKVSGESMEPDYYDGDIALVSQNTELNYGDVGIFIIDNSAFIKEYGKTELISRNPDSDNIQISEFDNIVCMGKVVGKL